MRSLYLLVFYISVLDQYLYQITTRSDMLTYDIVRCKTLKMDLSENTSVITLVTQISQACITFKQF